MSHNANERRKAYRAIIRRIVYDLNDRRGLHIDSLDSAVQKQIREEWYAIVADEMKKLEAATK